MVHVYYRPLDLRENVNEVFSLQLQEDLYFSSDLDGGLWWVSTTQASAGKAVQRAVSRPEDFWNNEDNLLIQVVDSPNRLEALPDQLFTNID